VCDALGYAFTIPDFGDIYNDGKVCTVNTCGSDGPVKWLVEDGKPCPEGGSGYCLGGECVECIGYLPGETQNCGVGQECDYIYCVPSSCTVSSSCGDYCKPCPAGFACDEHDDCKDGVCSLQGMCALPTCSDGAKNDGETDVDCGATECLNKCGDGKGCATEEDCESGVCWVGVCQAPTCSDGVLNGGESGIDCGGPCAVCP
jgi:hypothetical protein